MQWTSTKIPKDDWAVVEPRRDIVVARPRPALVSMIGAAVLAVGAALAWERAGATGDLLDRPLTGLDLPNGMVVLASAWATTVFVLWGLRRTRVVFHCLGAVGALVGLGTTIDAVTHAVDRAGSITRAIGPRADLALGLPVCLAGAVIAVAGAVQAARSAAATLPGRR